MLLTYPATARNDKLEGTAGGLPPLSAVAMPVQVTLLAATPSARGSGAAVAAAMEAFAAAGGPSGFDDPVEWQREQRIDRELPGREV